MNGNLNSFMLEQQQIIEEQQQNAHTRSVFSRREIQQIQTILLYY